jgi:hypothetical protein
LHLSPAVSSPEESESLLRTMVANYARIRIHRAPHLQLVFRDLSRFPDRYYH